MNQSYFEKWTDTIKKAQGPFHAIGELNVKTLQDIAYLKPEELAHIKKPEELVEKQITLAVENGHKALDYLQKSFQIMENAMFLAAQDVKKKV